MLRILASDGMEKSAVKALEDLGCEVVQQFYEPEDLKEQVKNFDALVVRSATKVREPIIDSAAAAGKLKVVIRGGVGVDNIDVQYAEDHGIKVRNTPRASSASVAELVVGHMFSAARYIGLANATMRDGKWEKKQYEGIEISGKTIGIIGYGRIGQELGKRCIALGMKVLAYDIYQNKDLENDSMKYADLDTLLGASDFISLHTPGAKGAPPLIGKAEIDKMKDGAVIINTSRGGNVDVEAVLDALDSEKLYAFGVDVYPEEPCKNERLLNHRRVSMTPHIGASTKEAQIRIGTEIVDIIKETFGL